MTITTGDKTLKEIHQVVAKLMPSMLTDDVIDSNVSVQALNQAGEALSIVSDPVQVKIQKIVRNQRQILRHQVRQLHFQLHRQNKSNRLIVFLAV